MFYKLEQKVKFSKIVEASSKEEALKKAPPTPNMGDWSVSETHGTKVK